MNSKTIKISLKEKTLYLHNDFIIIINLVDGEFNIWSNINFKKKNIVKQLKCFQKQKHYHVRLEQFNI
jgi:hypothetical protein